MYVRGWTKTPDDVDSRLVEVTSEDDDKLMFLHQVAGGDVGEVMRGVNREWYYVSPSQAAWADPLQGLDNVAGTGYSTPEDAVMVGLNLREEK